MNKKDPENQQKELISKLIKQIRYERHWTQKEFGEILGVSDQAIRAYESQKRLPKPELISKICSYVNMSYFEFMAHCNPHSSNFGRPIGTPNWRNSIRLSTGDYIREIRKAREMTQEELAEKIGVTKAMVSSYETGKCHPKISMLNRISEALQVSFDELITGYIREVCDPDVSSPKKNEFKVKSNVCIDANNLDKFPADEKPLDEEIDDGKERVIYSVETFTNQAIGNSIEIETPIVKQLELLNSAGQKKVFEYIKDLLSIPAYQRRETICQEQQKTQVPSESDQTEPGKQE